MATGCDVALLCFALLRNVESEQQQQGKLQYIEVKASMRWKYCCLIALCDRQGGERRGKSACLSGYEHRRKKDNGFNATVVYQLLLLVVASDRLDYSEEAQPHATTLNIDNTNVAARHNRQQTIINVVQIVKMIDKNVFFWIFRYDSMKDKRC